MLQAFDQKLILLVDKELREKFDMKMMNNSTATKARVVQRKEIKIATKGMQILNIILFFPLG